MNYSKKGIFMQKSITFIIGSMIGGGAERVISVISDMYAEDGYKVNLIIFRKTDKQYFINPKINCIYLSENESAIKRKLKLPFELFKAIKKVKSDIYVSFCIQENCYSCLVNLFARKKLIISERNAPKNEKLKLSYKIMRKLFYPVCDGIVFQTEEAKSCYSQHFQKKSAVISNPVKEGLPLKTDYSTSGKIVAAGRLCVQKNYPMLFKAMELFIKKYPTYKLYIYGNGPLEKELKALCDEMQLNDCIVFEGFSENIHKEMAEADIYVLSSDYEGMPNALMEAMAIGVPSVSADCPSGGPKELVEDGKNGMLVKTGDFRGLCEKLETLASSRELRENLGNEAKLIAEKYSKEKIFNEWKHFTDKR